MPTAKKTSTPRKTTAKRAPKKPAAKPEPKGTCFVMMPFRDPFGFYYQAIFKPAIIKAELDPIRADDLFRPSVIVSDLWQMIQDAKVLIAELTTKNANVFYELGLAHAIGKPVILVSETMDDVPFDLQQMRVLLYDKNDPAWGEKLSAGITRAITETLSTPIEAVPSIFRKIVESQAPEQDALTARIEDLEGEMRVLSAQRPRLRSVNPSPLVELAACTTHRRLRDWRSRWQGKTNLSDEEMTRLARLRSGELSDEKPVLSLPGLEEEFFPPNQEGPAV